MRKEQWNSEWKEVAENREQLKRIRCLAEYGVSESLKKKFLSQEDDYTFEEEKIFSETGG